MEKKEIILTKNVDTDELKGFVKYKAMSYAERIAASKKAVMEVNGGEHKIMGTLDRAHEYYELALSHCREINITIKETSEVLTSVDELMCYEEGQDVCMEIAQSLIGGITLGKKKPMDLDKIA